MRVKPRVNNTFNYIIASETANFLDLRTQRGSLLRVRQKQLNYSGPD